MTWSWMGNFITVGEGNALHRLVIGFGTGASTVQTQLQVYQAPEAHKLLEFTTRSDSGAFLAPRPCSARGRSRRAASRQVWPSRM